MKKKKILIVDDNKMMHKFLGNLLQKEGHEVLTAYDGYLALEKIIVEKPEILFIDLFMPKIGGEMLCRMIRKMPQMEDSYLVIISAALAEMDFDYVKIGADACIAKGPFDQMSLHVLSAIKDSRTPRWARVPKPIMGLSGDEETCVHPRQMTKELLSRYHHLESILDSTHVGLLELYSNVVVYANQHAEEILGIEKEDLLARSFAELFDREDQSRVEALLKPQTGRRLEIRPDNPVTVNNRQVSLKVFPNKGKVTSSIIQVRDVTHQNQMEFFLYQAGKNSNLSALAGVATKALQKQVKGFDQAIESLRQEPGGSTGYFKKAEAIEQYTREVLDISRQLSTLAEVKKLSLDRMGEPILKGTETILLADRDEILRMVDRLALEDLGYKVLVARTGKAAITKYETRVDKEYIGVDLVILDASLPDMDTRELIKTMKTINPKVKILISADISAEGKKAPPLPKGVGAFISKPFDIQEVASILRKVLGS